MSHRNSGVSGFGGLSTFSLIRTPGEPNSGIPTFLAVFCARSLGEPNDGMPKLTSFSPDSRAFSICSWSCSTNATCRQVLAPRPPVLSYDDPSISRSPSMGTSFHSLHATSQALQPMQIEVSVKNLCARCFSRMHRLVCRVFLLDQPRHSPVWNSGSDNLGESATSMVSGSRSNVTRL